MIIWSGLDTWSGMPLFMEAFWKSGVALGAALCASALLRTKSADLRRLALSISVVAMFVAAAVAPALPHWTAAAPAWFRLPQPASPTMFEPSAGPSMLDHGTGPLPQNRPAVTNLPSRQSPREVLARVVNRVPVIPLIWFAGAVVLLLRFIVGLRGLRRLRIASHALSHDELLPHLDRSRRRHRVSLLQNDTVDAPVTWGIVRSVILVPARFEQLPAECRSHVLCHEVAHIQGHDFALRVLVEIARAVIWFQPLMWITRRQLREEQELACDNRVLATGGRSSTYAKLLLDWDGGFPGRESLIAVGMAQRSSLKRRLHALLNLDTRRDTLSRPAIVATWFVGLATALPLAAFNFVQGPAPLRHAEAPSNVTMVERRPLPPPTSPARQAAVARAAPADTAQVQTGSAPSPAPDSQVVFEVASVKPCPPGDYSIRFSGGPGTGDPTRYSVENFTMFDLLEIAYGISSYQLSGPSWLDNERFTVIAKVPEGATKEQLKLMLRNLLIERFKLAAHFEKKDVAGYQLVVAKGGSKLAESPGDPNQNDDPAKPTAPFKFKLDKDGYPELPPGRQSSMAGGNGGFRWRFGDASMEYFADKLGTQMHQPIINATGLTGKYDFVVSWSYAAMQPNAPLESGPTIFAALQEQLGLKLESKKVPVDTVVVDHIERTPSEN
jgi:uncharacterized protein (TIGR03435 family)